MLPNFICFAVPAPNDILRTESVTPVVAAVGFTVYHLIFGVVNFVG